MKNVHSIMISNWIINHQHVKHYYQIWHSHIECCSAALVKIQLVKVYLKHQNVQPRQCCSLLKDMINVFKVRIFSFLFRFKFNFKQLLTCCKLHRMKKEDKIKNVKPFGNFTLEGIKSDLKIYFQMISFILEMKVKRNETNQHANYFRIQFFF